MSPHSRWLKISLLSLLALSALGGAPVQGEAYPTKPVKVIIPIGAASSPDVIARLVADRLTSLWRQQVLIINRPGGGGSIAVQAAAASEPDGYTLLFATTSTLVVLPETQGKLSFDLRRDFVPIGLVAEGPLVVAAASVLGVNTLGDAIALAKAKSEGLLYVANFRGSLPNMTCLLYTSPSPRDS